MLTMAVCTRYASWPPQLLPAITETNDLSAALLKLRQRGDNVVETGGAGLGAGAVVDSTTQSLRW